MEEHCLTDCDVEQEHDACIMVDPFGKEVLIDKKITPLILIIWNWLGLSTNNSCEDDFGLVWIQFHSLGDFEIFFSEIAQHRDKFPDLYQEMMDDWKYKICPYNFSEIIFSVSLWFPKEDLDRVLECLSLSYLSNKVVEAFSLVGQKNRRLSIKISITKNLSVKKLKIRL